MSKVTRLPALASSDPVIQEVMRLLGIPGDVAGFTVHASVDDVVRITLDVVARKAPDGCARITGLQSVAHEWAPVEARETLGR